MNAAKVFFIVAGYQGIGLGHCYRILALYKSLAVSNKHIIVMPDSCHARHFFSAENITQITTVATLSDLYQLVANEGPDLIINDILDTSQGYMDGLKGSGAKIINFEDIGPGHLSADLTINAIYNGVNSHNCLYGYQYIDIRNEFFEVPKNTIKPKVKNVLITLGGEDPGDITRRILTLVKRRTALRNLHYIVVIGRAYRWHNKLRAYLQQANLSFELLTQTNLASQMARADIAIVSNGRTPFELAAMGVPAVVLSAHARECLHTFHRLAEFSYCGNAQLINDKQIIKKIEALATGYPLRQRIRKRLDSLDLTSGQQRVKALIYQILSNRQEANNEQNSYYQQVG